MAIPVGETLRAVLDAAPRRATTILTTQEGTSWTSDGFRTSWGKACKRAGIDDVTFHDLRGTAVTRLALAGCEVPEIAAITGHSLKDATPPQKVPRYRSLSLWPLRASGLWLVH